MCLVQIRRSFYFDYLFQLPPAFPITIVFDTCQRVSTYISIHESLRAIREAETLESSLYTIHPDNLLPRNSSFFRQTCNRYYRTIRLHALRSWFVTISIIIRNFVGDGIHAFRKIIDARIRKFQTPPTEACLIEIEQGTRRF